MIRGDNACALLSYCFKPFANSEGASLNSRSGGSFSKLKGEKLSLLQKKTLFRHEVGGFPKPTTSPQRTAAHPVSAQGALTSLSCPAASSTSLALTFTARQRSLASWPGLTVRFQERNFTGLWHLSFVPVFWELTLTRFTCFLNGFFPMHRNGTAQFFPAILDSFILFLEFPYRRSFLHCLLLTSSGHQPVLFISFWKPLGLPV